APGTGDHVVTTVALQQSSFGEPLDDLIVDTEAVDNSRSRLSLQVKRSLTVSAATTNKDFREIVHNSWKTLQKDDFRVGIDRYGGATGTIAEDSFRNLITVCEWARASSSLEHFSSRFSKKGNASGQHKNIKNKVSILLSEVIEREASESEIHSFFSHFVLIKFDFLHEGSTNQADLINRLRSMLTPEDNVHAPDLWAQLRVIAREGSGHSAEFQRHNLLANLKRQYRFRGISSFAEDLSTLSRLANEWLRDISSDIGGIKVERTTLLNGIKQSINENRFVQIRGLPGAGKSTALKAMVQQKLESGSVLFLKSDRLSGNSWQEFATSMGLHIKDPEKLLSEIGSTGSSLLFIDGIDRIDHSQRRIVLDLIETIMSSSALSDWHIVVTARDAGIEPLRTWLPEALFQSPGISTIDIKPFNDEESNKLAELLPALRGILFGNNSVREIARRPFFASILIEELALSNNKDTFLPQSEIDLIERWWIRGGYDAGDSLATKRQRALIDLAKNYLRRIGRPIQLSNLMADTVNILNDLISDGILHTVRPGHTIKFAHDIFLEWSYVHFLIDRDDQWVNEVIDAGEPPFLGRTVELLSQSKFILDEEWKENFTLISKSELRPQWHRSWLIGPFEIPNFKDKQSLLESIVFDDEYKLLRKLLVWFQAERTAPNAMVLSGELCPPDYQRNEIIRIADALGWPSNIKTWSRLIYWLKGNVPNFPSTVVPYVISIFEVWQNMFADINNSISNYIVNQSLIWLNDIEERQYPKEFTTDRGFWNDLDRDELQEVEKSLRTIVLRSARVFPDVAQSYLEKIAPHKRIRHHIYSDIIGFSTVLSESLPELLANIARQELMNELPEDQLLRKQKERREQAEAIRKIREKSEKERDQRDQVILSSPTSFFSSKISSHDWEHLSIGPTHQGYFPASPLREPFHSLFKLAPNIALDLVRDISNHAITTWQQLHNLDFERRGNPIPVKLSFPWGNQNFWGNNREYLWFRGWFGPQAIKCAYLALESWAFNELDNGKSPDHVIETVVKGHNSVAVLGIAVSILLRTNQITEVTLQLISCQRLWHADLHRFVSEQGNSSSGFIGFNNERLDKTHIEALQKTNQLAFRKSELRQLTPLFVLSSAKRIRDHAQKAIESFPNELPFLYEEEKADKQQCDALKATAENWAEWGHEENYISKP
ncbi:MAG: NACHT domain-containing protein, partial [Cyclobacteriaceae bacterium]